MLQSLRGISDYDEQWGGADYRVLLLGVNAMNQGVPTSH